MTTKQAREAIANCVRLGVITLEYATTLHNGVSRISESKARGGYGLRAANRAAMLLAVVSECNQLIDRFRNSFEFTA